MLQLHVPCGKEDDDIQLLQRGWGLSVKGLENHK